MKITIAITALILAAATGFSWKIDGRLAAARAEERKLSAEAAGFGISIGDGHLIRSVKRERVDREVEAKRFAVEFYAEATKWESVRSMDSAAQASYRDLCKRFEALEPSQMKSIITDLLASKDLPGRIRAESAVALLGILARKDPHGALALITEYYGAIRIVPHAQSIISDCLGAWAKDDPAATVEWMKKNPGVFPEEAIKSSQRIVIHSVAEKDPRLAFRLAAEFDTNPATVLHSIVTAAGNNEARNVTLAALREYLGAQKDDPTVSQQADRSFGYFSWDFKPDGFEAARQWVASANLSPQELESFCAGLSISSEVDEPARWIEWMGATFPPGKGDDQIVNLISRWTRDDYEAAGKWLGSAAEGPVKNAAIRGYAQAIFPQEPETAIQWLMTLPPGKDRDSTLKNIHRNWPENDPAAKEAFVGFSV